MKAAAVTPGVVGTTPAQINANFCPTLRSHLLNLKATRGEGAVYAFLWSLSSFQFYEMEQVYYASCGGSMFGLLLEVLGPDVTSARTRLVTINLQYKLTGATVPGGRRAVAKLGTFAGWPIQTTLYEIYLEYATMPGLTATQAIEAAVVDFTGPGLALVLGSYAAGTGISWMIQTYDPSLQRGIGDLIGPLVDGTVDAAINTIDVLGSPGLNEVDFDGYQLGDPSFYNLP